ncbi:MAG: glutathione S-transferase family protein [Xenococcaceae cyanobacterium MO_167.B52]|nr:glutathione S-transferase family protein [Xenococcaceae cyanobacterium MO_167.B52]
MQPNLSLYWISGSPPSWRVMLTLAVKKLSYQSILLDASKKEQKQADYLNLNPRGTVPTLVIDDKSVRESLAIIRVLELIQPEPALFGRNWQETAQIDQWIEEFNHFFGKESAFIARSLFRRQIEVQREQLANSISVFQKELDIYLETLESGQPYVCGDNLTAADLILFPVVMWLERAFFQNPQHSHELGLTSLLETYKPLKDWAERIKTIDGYENTYPPHWKVNN